VFDDDLRRAIETIKLRAPIEELVRERVPALRKAGALWVACCPFHDEKTPSFKVDPRRGSWHCYGACSAGGDVISFLERMDNLAFLEVLEMLAARTGVELPRSRRKSGPEGEDQGLEILLEAERAFHAALATREARPAREYLAGRGLLPNTLDAFALGWSSTGGRQMLDLAATLGRPIELFERTGLVRVQDSGSRTDFFRGRLVIPIRDLRGRTVGFGARRLSDENASGPKYINTAETPWFKKSTLIYGLDRALEHVRRSGRLVLVEGYTDVMAAHQAGVGNVAAVMGTATTEDHAALVRRTGARRVSLVFDGDEAGRKAAWRALAGLLGLDVELEVVCLPGGQDPCDLLVREGAEAFLAHLEHARGWFDHVCDGLGSLRGVELAREADRILNLLGALKSPVHREARIAELAERLHMPVERVREQWELTADRSRARPHAPAPKGADASAPAPAAPDARILRAWESVLGAVLVDTSLLALARPHFAECADPDLSTVFEHLLALYADVEATIDEASVLSSLADHPARGRVVPCASLARAAESPRVLLDGALRCLRERALAAEKAQLTASIADLEPRAAVGEEEAVRGLDEALRRLNQIHRAGVPLHQT
jgi:DNA primase